MYLLQLQCIVEWFTHTCYFDLVSYILNVKYFIFLPCILFYVIHLHPVCLARSVRFLFYFIVNFRIPHQIKICTYVNISVGIKLILFISFLGNFSFSGHSTSQGTITVSVILPFGIYDSFLFSSFWFLKVLRELYIKFITPIYVGKMKLTFICRHWRWSRICPTFSECKWKSAHN